MKVYIKQYDKKLLWKGDDWTTSMDLASTFELDQAEQIINKRWHKGVREYVEVGGGRVIVYNPKPVTQTAEDLGRWDRI